MKVRAYILSFLVVCGPVFAQYDNCCCPCEKLFWAEALYFQPSTFNFDYAVKDSTYLNRIDESFKSPIGKEQGSCPHYEWGFRLGIRTDIDCCCKMDARLVYSRLCADHRESTHAKKNEALWPTFGTGKLLQFDNDVLLNGYIPAIATNKHDINWNAVDAEVGYKSRKRGCLFIRANLGLHWANICIDRKLTFQGTEYDEGNFSINYCSCFQTNVETWGIGPRIGGQAIYDLGCCLSLEARMGWGLLAGEVHNRIRGEALEKDVETKQTINEGRMKVNGPRDCLVFPEFDASLGLNFHVCQCYCYDLTLGLGWEFRSYLNAVRQQYYLSNHREGLHATSSDSFNLQGLYIRGVLRF